MRAFLGRAVILKNEKNIDKPVRRIAAWAATLLATFFVLAWIVAASDSFQACLAGDTDSVDETSFVRRTAEVTNAPTTLQCVGYFLDQNETTILALAALAMVFFGLALWAIGTRVQRAFLAQVPARQRPGTRSG